MQLKSSLILFLFWMLTGCGSEVQVGDKPIELTVLDAPATAPAGELLTLQVVDVPSSGLAVEVIRGGGQATVGPDLTIEWRVGIAPVDQTLRISHPQTPDLEVTLRATLDTPFTSAPFADVHQFLLDEGRMGSTEDLTFVGDTVLLGGPGGIIRINADGGAQWLPLSGAGVGRGWGLAADDTGILWVVDAAAKALVRVDTDGEVTIALSEAEGIPFDGLNYVDVGPDGRVYASDPCTGRIVRYDPKTQMVDAVLHFDRATQGGPNGLVFDADGVMYTITENTVLLCADAGIAALDAPLANLFRITVDEAGFGDLELVKDELGVFGDGITFDAEGNLYVIADTVEALQLDESIVWLFPAGEAEPTKFLVADEVLYANLEFGRGAMGNRTLYLALLAIPGLTPVHSRGLQRIEVGIPGGVHPRPTR